MISVKLQIDCLIKSNKIVIFFDESKKEWDDVNNQEHEKSRTKNYLYAPHPINSQAFAQKQKVLPQLDIVKLFDMYGITKKYVTIVEMNSLRNPKVCENYMKNAYCNDIDIKYPLVFMHGIFFGSNDEILFAHEEGFLFELFKDTGFYTLGRIPSSIPYSLTNTSGNFDRDNPNQDFDEILENLENKNDLELTEEEEEDESRSEFCSTTIEKPRNFNVKKRDSKKKFKSYSNIETIRNFKILRNISSESFQDFNSESSSILSLNKDSYCQHYVNENDSVQIKKSYDIDLKNLINANKRFQIKEDDSYASQSNHSMRNFTPPGDVLATINTWAKKTKDAIKIRNIQICKKNADH